MKNTSIKHLSLLASLSLIALVTLPVANKTVSVSAAGGLPTTIYLNDNPEEEVRSYYSSLDGLNESELRGENLLKNLKTILAKENTFYEYGTGKNGIAAIYLISDRNWEASPASSIDATYGTYNASNNTITNYKFNTDENPYIFHYYVERDYQKDHPIRHREEGASRVSFDKEHIWAKSHGFGLDDDANVATGAGTDLHHLVAANPSVNSAAHNANSYGNVATNAYNAPNDYLKSNKRGTPKTPHTGDEDNVVFEPQDADKGDIARALFYMVARYNYIGSNEQPTKEEPNLQLVDHVIKSSNGFDCTTTKEAAPYGVISDIIQWNRMDAPDDYEVHRNNLVYNNFQHNRNPFIDFPTWIDLIWNEDGTYYTGSEYAKPATDEMNVGNNYVEPTEPSILDNKTLLIIGGVVAVIIIIVIIILVATGKAKVKVTKSGKVKVTATKSKSSSSKKSSSSSKKSSSTSKKSTSSSKGKKK